MDLLFKRYASPFSFIEGMMNTGRFDEFVVEFLTAVRDELEEKTTWEVYLHKVHEGSYKDFVDEIENDKKNQNMTDETKESILQNSLSILDNFNPIEGGEQ